MSDLVRIFAFMLAHENVYESERKSERDRRKTLRKNEAAVGERESGKMG